MLQLHSSVGGYSVVPTLAGRLFSPLKNDVLEKPGPCKYSGSESSFRRANPELYVWETMSSTWSPGSSRVSSGNTGGKDYAPVCSQGAASSPRGGPPQRTTLVLFRVMLFCWGLFLSLVHSVAYSCICTVTQIQESISFLPERKC